MVEVVAIGIEQQVIREAVIENPIAGPQHRLGRLSPSANAVGKRDPGSKIYFVGNVVLRLEAQSIADGEVGPRLPVVFCIEAQVGDAGLLRGRSGGDGELAGLGGKVAIQIRVGVRSLKVCVGIIRVLDVAKPAAEADVVLGKSQRGVILKLEMVLRIADRASGAAAALKILQHIDRRSNQLRVSGCRYRECIGNEYC